jgi:hypothetical protein
VVCQLDALCDYDSDQDRLDALERFPHDLDESYERILQKVMDSKAHNTKEMVRKALLWICFCSQQSTFAESETKALELNVDDLCMALSIGTGTKVPHAGAIIKKEKIAKWCSSLIRYTANGRAFEPAHLSVLEYLRDMPEDSKYSFFRFDMSTAAESLAEVCLCYLQFDNFHTDIIDPALELRALAIERAFEKRQKDYPFYGVAARSWINNRLHMDSNRIVGLASALFVSKKPQTLRNWLLNYLEGNALDFVRDGAKAERINICVNLMREKHFSSLHIAAAMAWPEMCDWLCNVCKLDPNAWTSIGSPLDCVLHGATSLRDSTYEIGATRRTSEDLQAVAKTIDILVAAGATGAVPEGYTSLAEVALDLAVTRKAPELVVPFIQAGKCLDSGFLEKLRGLCDARRESSWTDPDGDDDDDDASSVNSLISDPSDGSDDTRSTAQSEVDHEISDRQKDGDEDNNSGHEEGEGSVETESEHGSEGSEPFSNPPLGSEDPLETVIREIRTASDNYPLDEVHISIKSLAHSEALRADKSLLNSRRFIHFSSAKVVEHDFGHSISFAIEFNRLEAFQSLMADERFNGESLHFGPERRTMIHMATRNSPDRILPLLLESGFKADVLDGRGRTALFDCRVRRVGPLRMLLDHGVRSDIADSDGLTVWHALASDRASHTTLKTLAKLDHPRTKLQALRCVSKSG